MAARFESSAYESYGAVQASSAGTTVPDAAMLFQGHFARSGTDLHLTGPDGQKFVVAEYFATDNPPNLMSPEGAMLTGDTVTALAGPQFAGMYAQAGGAAGQGAKAIGKVQSIDGSATVVRSNGITETLKEGDPVFQGDVLMTGPGSKLGVGFVDGTVFSMNANARMVLNKLVYNPDGSDNSMLFSLVEGTFVFAAGKIAPTGDMKFNTPVATMGIRGTSGVVEIEAANGPTKFKLIPDPRDGHEGSYILYNLETGQPFATVDNTGNVWRVTDANGNVNEFPKSAEELESDSQALSDIASVFNSWTNSPDGPEAGPNNNSNSSGGFNDPPPAGSIDGNTQGDPQNEGTPPPPGEGENTDQQGSLPTPPPDFDDIPPLEEVEDDGVTVIVGTPDDDNGAPGGDGQPDNPPALIGTPGDDVIIGLAGDDFINPGDGDDIVDAGPGNDTIIAGAGNGNDQYDGGEGTDTIIYTSADAGVTINLVNGTVFGPDVDFDTIVNIERFFTGIGDDTLVISDLQQLPDNFFWDAGDGKDTVLFEGNLSVDTADFDGDIENIEVIDLNDDPTTTNSITISADDISGPDTNDTLQFRGGPNDTVNLTNEFYDDYGYPLEGQWVEVQNNSDNPPFTEDGITFVTYEFMVDGQTVATAHVQVDVQVNIVPPLQEAVYGSKSFANVPNNAFVSIELTREAIDGLNSADGLFAIGGEIVSLDDNQFTQEYLFGFSGSGNPSNSNSRLVLQVEQDGQISDVTINTVERGWYNSAGQHTTSNDNYIAGNTNGVEYRNFFVFDLSGVTGTVVGASLELLNPSGGFTTGDLSETYVLHAVTTSIGDLIDGTGGIEAFNDLGGAPDNLAALDVDPLILDLNGDGVQFSSEFVSFDFDGSGDAERIGWTSGQDGLLVIDANGDGVISSGDEVVSPEMVEGVTTSLEALESFDSNQDGVIDAQDENFDNLAIWQDANENAVTDEGELASLSDLGVTSISLDTNETNEVDANGNVIQSQGLFTFADGTTATYSQVTFAAETTNSISDSVVAELISGTDADDILSGGSGDNILSGGLGADTYVISGFDDGIDTITDYEGLDALDLSAYLTDPLNNTGDLGQVIDEYISAITDNDGDTTVYVDADGNGTDADPTAVAVLQGYDGSAGINITVGSETDLYTPPTQPEATM